MEKKVMQCAIYSRQSKTRDGSESIGTQIEICRAACERYGFNVVTVLAEPPSTSGYKRRGKDRTKFKRLLAGFINHDWDMVMAYKTDRLSRGGGPGWAPLLEAIEKAGLDIDRAIATPSGFVSEFEIGIRASMDREESKKLSDRMTDIAARKALQGKPQGGRRAFGYCDDMVTIKEDEAAILREMAQQVISGRSFKEIAWWLNTQNVTTTTGKLFYAITVRNMLYKPRYKGVRVYKDQEIKAQWKPIFDLETWEKLQLTLTLRREAASGRPKPRRYLLTGVVFCATCGKPMNGMTKRDKPSRPLRRTYQCRSQGYTRRHDGCGGVTRNADALEHWVTDSIFAHLGSDSLLELLGVGGEDATIIRDLIDDRKNQRTRLDQLVDDYATGLLKRDQFERAKTTAESELTRIERLLTRYSSTHAVLSMLPTDKSIAEAWRDESDDWRRTLVSSLIDRIMVAPSRSKPFYRMPDGTTARFNPAAISIEWRSFK